jgi:hypothetical protein
MENGNSPSEGARLILFKTWLPHRHIDTPEGAINRLRTIDVRIGSDARSTGGETGLATPRR